MTTRYRFLEFPYWLVAGALVAAGIYGLPSIGLLLIGAGAALAVGLHRRSRLTAPAIAATMMLGGALALAVLGIVALPYTPCVEDAQGFVTVGGETGSCGGFDPLIYFVPAGALLIAAAGLTAATTLRRPGEPLHRATAAE